MQGAVFIASTGWLTRLIHEKSINKDRLIDGLTYVLAEHTENGTILINSPAWFVTPITDLSYQSTNA